MIEPGTMTLYVRHRDLLHAKVSRLVHKDRNSDRLYIVSCLNFDCGFPRTYGYIVVQRGESPREENDYQIPAIDPGRACAGQHIGASPVQANHTSTEKSAANRSTLEPQKYGVLRTDHRVHTGELLRTYSVHSL